MDMISEYTTPKTCKHGIHVTHCDDRSGKYGLFGKSWEELRCPECAKEGTEVEIDGKRILVKDA